MKRIEIAASGSVKNIEPADIPAEVLEWFERRSRMFVSDYKPGNWLCFYSIELADGHTIWVACQTKTYKGKAGTEHLHYLYEASGSDMVGYSELRFNLDQERTYFKGKPFEGFNYTDEKYRRKGFALRRVMIMNAFALVTHGYPLASDTVLGDRDTLLWKKLEADGFAKSFKEGPHPRWQMAV